MSAATRIWLATVIGGLALVAIGAGDAFLNHSAFLSQAGDASLIVSGVGAILGKSAYDIGVQVPTPPKP